MIEQGRGHSHKLVDGGWAGAFGFWRFGRYWGVQGSDCDIILGQIFIFFIQISLCGLFQAISRHYRGALRGAGLKKYIISFAEVCIFYLDCVIS